MAATSTYHRILRVSLLVVACVLVFDSGIVSPVTRVLSDRTAEYLASAAVGMFASVPETEVNKLSSELSAWERELNAREAALNAREISAREFAIPEDRNISTYILSIILFILTVLILWNYILDWERVKMLRDVSYRDAQSQKGAV